MAICQLLTLFFVVIVIVVLDSIGAWYSDLGELNL